MAVPGELVSKNMLIEISGYGKQEFRTFYSNQLKVTVLEAYGELKVTHEETKKPLPSVYVKVFAEDKYSRKATFFRDGYTDITGKFEYVAGNKLGNVGKFAILVQSDKYGSKIQECKPPKTVNT